MTTYKLLLGISLTALCSCAAWAQSTNTSQYSQTGTGNVANVDNTANGNVGNSSTVVQNGSTDSATIYQRGFYNQSDARQAGTTDVVVHQQSGSTNAADSTQTGDYLNSAVAQVGTTNTARVTQGGAYDTSTVRQGYAIDATAPAGEFRSADFNTATVDQSGSGLASEVGQRGASASAPPASQNVAYVYQRSSTGSPSVQQLSRIIQESAGNYAELFQYEGNPAAPNSSTITQRNAGASGASSNWASVAEQGAAHTSLVTQDGLRNSATVRMQGGGPASGAGNQITILQSGNSLTAGARLRSLSSGRARGNRATVQQTGDSHNADLYQFGVSDQANLSQSNGANTGTYTTGAVARGQAFISQNSDGDTATVSQRGDNLVDVTQAFGAASAVTVDQTDAGDLAGARARNSLIVTQYGVGNATYVAQNAIGATATTWQQVGSSADAIIIGQGTGGTGLSSTTAVSGFASGSQGAGASNLLANVVQASARNSATVYQDGTSLTATVSQYGTGASGLSNLVFVSQTGAGNVAVAYQGTGVGPSSAGDTSGGNSSTANGGGSADEFYFAGGARSAEIDILQTTLSNSASVYQYGRGQLARIEQSGSSNVAGIVQEAGATNATAVIRQSGANNSYYVDQVAAGQYIAVTQTGSNNVASNVQRGPSGGTSGFTAPPGFPGH